MNAIVMADNIYTYLCLQSYLPNVVAAVWMHMHLLYEIGDGFCHTAIVTPWQSFCTFM